MPLLRLLAPVADDDVTGVRGQQVRVSPDIAARLIAQGKAVPVTEGRQTAVRPPDETR